MPHTQNAVMYSMYSVPIRKDLLSLLNAVLRGACQNLLQTPSSFLFSPRIPDSILDPELTILPHVWPLQILNCELISLLLLGMVKKTTLLPVTLFPFRCSLNLWPVGLAISSSLAGIYYWHKTKTSFPVIVKQKITLVEKLSKTVSSD